MHSSIKTMFRSPAKTLVTFVLLVATSFAFVSRGVEYAATVRQINAAEASYSAVGTVQKTLQGYYDYMVDRVGEEVYTLEDGVYLDRTDRAIVPLDDAVLDILAESEYVDVTEVRHYGGGTHDDLIAVEECPLSDFTGYEKWKEGTRRTNGSFGYGDYWIIGVAKEKPTGASCDIFIRLILTAYPDKIHVSEYQTGDYTTGDTFIRICNTISNIERNGLGEDSPSTMFWQQFIETTEGGDTIAVAAAASSVALEFERELLPCVDYPMVNLSLVEKTSGETDIAKVLADPAAYGCLRYPCPKPENCIYENLVGIHDYNEMLPIPQEGQAQIKVSDYFATVERNIHTSEVVYTSDMSIIQKAHLGLLYPLSGRLLTSDDHDDVCVIGADFAEHNDLRVGDHITLDLCADTLVHSGKVFGRETPYPTDRDVIGENQLTERGLPNVTKTFEIVGIWSDVNFDVEDPFTYSLNTIFVPADCYPWQGEVEPSALPSTLSFRLNYPGDMAAIEAELGDQLAELGYELRIDDGGYAAAKPNLEFMKLTALIGFVGMSLALLLALVLIAYLFIIRKKKDYAIMRALGTPRGKSNRSLLFGLLTLAAVAIIIGAVAAGIVEQSSTARMAADVAEITGDATVSGGAWGLTVLFGVGTLALVWLFARVGLAKISRTPPLELLQGSGR